MASRTPPNYKWKSEYGGLEASEPKRVKELEAENAKLKRLYADMALEHAAMKDLVAKTLTPDGRREAARYLVTAHRIPVTRACGCAGLTRSAYYQDPVNWIVRDAEIVAALARLIEERPSRGFWKCYQRLRLEGFTWNHKRIYRVYCLMKLNLHRKAKQRLP